MEQTDTVLPAGSLSAELRDAAASLGGDPRAAETRIRRILGTRPCQPEALMLLSCLGRLSNGAVDARAALEEIVETHPDVAAPRYELGLLLSAAGRDEEALRQFLKVVALEPRHERGWRKLGDVLAKGGKPVDAARAYRKHVGLTARTVRTATQGLSRGPDGYAAAGEALTAQIARHPSDACAGLALAELELRLQRFDEAEQRLTQVLEAAPGFALARYLLAMTLYRRTKIEAALEHLALLLRDDPGNSACLNLKAMCLVALGEYDPAAATYETLLREEPAVAPFWTGYGHVLKTVGRIDDAVRAYRKAVELDSGLGEAYWQLADLKVYRFSAGDIDRMRAALARPTLSPESRAQIHFALGKALEDGADHAAAFAEYAKGNAVRRQGLKYNADDTSALVRRSKALFTDAFFTQRKGWGDPAPDPIFVLGLTRSGSTLVEQILASHPMVEGTKELPTLGYLAQQLLARRGDPALRHPEIVSTLDEAQARALGAEYIAMTRAHRKLGRPRFVDKMPSNFLFLGLLHLMLPNAKIVDARRHPLACGFANFKQHFTQGQEWSYSLADIGRYYRDYVELMAHFDTVLPGRIHRVVYENLVADPEREVRALLDHCGLPFDDACLRFHENRRPVLTASAEQVRRPIFTDGLEQWRRFDPWLGPLREALGDVLDAYPEPPPAFCRKGS